jgi:hypothetical protein
MSQTPINDMDEEMVIETYNDDFAIVSFCNEESEYVNEAMIATENLPDVIQALQAEYDRRTS